MINRNNSIHKYDDFCFSNLKSPEWCVNSIEKMKGKCIWCGKILPKRKRKYCNNDCRLWCQYSIHDLQVTSLRRYIHQRDNFECQLCGKHFSRMTPAGVELTEHMGHVHHLQPLRKGGEDHHSNMILLCKKCHKEKHKK